MTRIEDLDLDNLDENVLNTLNKGKFADVSSFLHASPMELCRITGLTIQEITNARSVICSSYLKQLPQPQHIVTGKQINDGEVPKQLMVRKLSLACPVLDKFLRGGIPSQGVTELAGESASGKTQICLQLSLTVQLPTRLGGLEGGSVYICTEDVFPSKRLHQMIGAMKSRYLTLSDVATIRFSDRIYVEHASDKDHLFHCVFNKLPHLLSRDLVRLIIIDSTAALFRCEYTTAELVQRAKDMTSLAGRLHKISAEYNIPVICVNQVTDVIDGSISLSDQQKRKFLPSLGLTWSNLMTTRILTSRTEQSIPTATGSTVVRTIEVLSAPHLPPSVCRYYVDNGGVKGIKMAE